MDTVDEKIVAGYLKRLKGLAPHLKQDLIARLQESLPASKSEPSQFEEAYGATPERMTIPRRTS